MIINEDGTYLENYLSTIGELPNDIKRTLAVIKELDLLTSHKLFNVAVLAQEAISAPPFSEARKEIMKSIQTELAETEALAEEKKSLVAQSTDLVDGHKKTLELVLDKFKTELFGESPKETFDIFKSKAKRKKSLPVVCPLKKKRETGDIGPESVVKENETEREEKKKSVTKKKEEKKEKAGEIKKEKVDEKEAATIPSETKSAASNAHPEKAEAEAGEAAGGEDEDTNLYCFCQRMSFGDMIECDNPKCKYQWFHFECLGITSAPKGKWYCPECKKMKKRKR